MARCKICAVEGVKLYDYGDMALCLFCLNDKAEYDRIHKIKPIDNTVFVYKKMGGLSGNYN